MTDQEIREALAEKRGWKFANTVDIEKSEIWQQYFGTRVAISPTDGGIWNLSVVPDYPADLNAVHEVEKLLEVRLLHVYFNHLTVNVNDGNDQLAFTWVICHATARQRCEALLRTWGLWKETKT